MSNCKTIVRLWCAVFGWLVCSLLLCCVVLLFCCVYLALLMVCCFGWLHEEDLSLPTKLHDSMTTAM